MVFIGELVCKIVCWLKNLLIRGMLGLPRDKMILNYNPVQKWDINGRHVCKQTNPELLHNAPLTLPVKRLDDVKAARELDLNYFAEK